MRGCPVRVRKNFRVRVSDGDKWLVSCDLRWRKAIAEAEAHARAGRRAQLVDAFGDTSADVPPNVSSLENWWGLAPNG
jgi:hypothetical protein